MFESHELQRSGFFRCPPDGVWLPTASDHKPFAYSDGHIEAWLYQLFSESGDLKTGSPILEGHIHNWPSRYHLSPQRLNLLRPLHHLLAGKNVLEIGAGCGAITRYLGEVADNVVAVEGSVRRASIAKRRCEGLANVEVVAANVMDFAYAQRFDVITLVGVLEYSRQFIEGPDPVHALIERCRSLLADDGVLIVAIENQLGLKYFAGAPEDHVGKAYYGLEDGYGERDPVTFGRRELTEKLHRGGLQGIRFYYPFPDYKMPITVVTEEGAQRGTALMENLSSQFSAFDQGSAYVRRFSEQAAWAPIIRNGLLGELANSFLLVARRDEFTAQDDCLRRPGDLAYIYSTNRLKRFHKESFICEEDGVVQVRRARLYTDETPAAGALSQYVSDELATTGRSLYRGLVQTVTRPGWSAGDIAAWAKPWLELLNEGASAPSKESPLPMVPGIFVDATPANLLWNEDHQLQCIDLEWDAGAKIPLHWVLFRGLVHSLSTLDLAAPPAAATPLESVVLAVEVMAHLGLPLNKAECTALMQLECRFFGGTLPVLLGKAVNVRREQMT